MRSSRSTKRLEAIINQENSLPGRIWRKSEFLQKLDSEIRLLLPDRIQAQCHLANISKKELTIHIQSASLLTRLRLFQPVIINHINRHYDWATIEKVNIKIRPVRKRDAAQAPETRCKSAFGYETIKSSAEQCHNKELKSALEKLAQHIKPADK